jgi:hypothetical protein
VAGAHETHVHSYSEELVYGEELADAALQSTPWSKRRWWIPARAENSGRRASTSPDTTPLTASVCGIRKEFWVVGGRSVIWPNAEAQTQEVVGILKPESMKSVAGREAAFSISGFPLSAWICRYRFGTNPA